MNALLQDVTSTVKVNFLSKKPVVGAVVGALVAVAVPTLLKLKGSSVEEAVKVAKTASVKV
jgi:hypothetical protein